MSNRTGKPVHQINWDRLTALFSMFVAFCALATSLWQGHLTMVHNRLSVTPLLQLHRSTDDDNPRYQLFLENNGLGPAHLLGADLTLDGKPVSNLRTALASMHVDLSLYNFNEANADEGVIKPGDSRAILDISPKDKAPNTFEAVSQILSRMRIDVRYESLYQEKHRESVAL